MNRLSKILARAGVAARRKCEDIIHSGRVTVNGKVIILPQTLVDPEKDTILLDGKPIKMEKKVYYLLNKPKGYVCSPILGGRSYKMATSLIPEKNRLFMVGRLDKDTTGLLLITNDGQFANQVIHPSFGLNKEYIAKISQEITDKDLKNLSKGAYVQNVFIKPIKVKKVRKGTVKVVISEGKKREVRKLIASCGLNLLELKRVRIGNLHLGNLPIGTYRTLSQIEREALLATC